MLGCFLPPKIFILLAKAVVRAVSSSIRVEAGHVWLSLILGASGGNGFAAGTAQLCRLWFDSWSQSTAVKSDSAHTWLWLGVKSWVVLAVTEKIKKRTSACFGRASSSFSHCSWFDPAWSWQGSSWSPSLLLLDRTQTLHHQLYGRRKREPEQLQDWKPEVLCAEQQTCETEQMKKVLSFLKWKVWGEAELDDLFPQAIQLSHLARLCITGGALFTGCTFTRRHRSTMINYLITDTQRSKPGTCWAVLSPWFPTLHAFLLADSQNAAVVSRLLMLISEVLLWECSCSTHKALSPSPV